MEIFCDKISLTGCKWPNLNAPGSGTSVSHSLLKSSLFPFSALPFLSFLSLQNEELGYYGRLGKKVEILRENISFAGCKWSNLNAPGSGTPVSHSLLKISLSLQYKELGYYGRRGKKGGTSSRQNQFNRQQMVQKK